VACRAPLLAPVAFAAAAAAEPLASRAVVLSGDPAPGVPNATFASFSGTPVVNDDGRVAFNAALSEAPTAGIWTDVPGELVRVAYDTQPAPGTSAFFTGLSTKGLLLSDEGEVAFRAELAGEGVDPSNSHGIWVTSGGVLQLAARNGGPAPGLPPGTYGMQLADPVVLGGNSNLVFLSNTAVDPPSESYTGVYSGAWGAIDLAARTDDPGEVSSGFSGFSAPFEINDEDVLSVRASVFTPDGPRQGIYTGLTGGLFATVVSRAPVDDLPGAYYGPQLGALGLDNSNVVAFENRLVDANGSLLPNPSTLWVFDAQGKGLVAREGDPLPGTPGVTLGQFTGRMVLDDTGQVLFVATLYGTGVDSTNNECLMSWSRARGLERLVRLGDPAPGVPGATVAAFGTSPVANGFGQWAIHATLNVLPSSILLGGSPGLAPYLIYRQGTNFLARPGVTLNLAVTLPALLPSGGSDGRGRSLNDRGEIVVRSSYVTNDPIPVGGTGIFVLAMPPAPLFAENFENGSLCGFSSATGGDPCGP
jgi:hypothetical protein